VFGDGEQTRDLIYVKDVADGLVKAFSSQDANGEVFNLSTGVETSVNSLLSQIMTTTGKRVEPDHGPPSVGDIRRMCYSNEKAQRVFNFKVRHPLDIALKEYLEWYRNK
jgi:UDP-glucose 4-epimerase